MMPVSADTSKTGRTLKVLHVIDHLGKGGAQRYVVQMAGALKRTGFDVEICSLRPPRIFSAEAARLGISVRHLDTNYVDPLQLLTLLAFMRNRRPDVVHTHLTASNFFGTLAARIARVPCVVAHDHLGPNFWTSPGAAWPFARRIHLLLDRTAQRLADRVIVVSKSLAEYRLKYLRLERSKLHVFPNVVDLGVIRECRNGRAEVLNELGLPPDAFVIGTAGRLSSEKGQAVLLEAVARLSDLPPGTVILLIGEGPLRRSLEDRAERLGLAGRLRMTGWREDAVRLMSVIDIFVMPSYFETFGNALIEAMALGKPVVASHVGGMPEILSSPSCGRLVPPGDPDALAGEMEELIRNPELRRRIGEAGRSRVEENYSLEKNAFRMKHFYMELAERFRPVRLTLELDTDGHG